MAWLASVPVFRRLERCELPGPREHGRKPMGKFMADQALKVEEQSNATGTLKVKNCSPTHSVGVQPRPAAEAFAGCSLPQRKLHSR